MKILIVSQYYYPERFSVTDIAETLTKFGHNVSVLTGKPNYGYGEIIPEYKKVKYEIINGVKVYRVNLYPRKSSRLSVIANYLSFHDSAKLFVNKFKTNFDVVLAFSLSPIISVSPGIKYAKKHKIPCVLFCEDLWPESTTITGAVRKNSLVYRILYHWSKSIYSRVDKIIISSPSFQDYFIKELGIKNKKFVHINQPVISSKEHIEPVNYLNKFNFVYAGNIGSIQLIDLLIDAMKLVKNKDAKLHLIGMGSNLEKIKERILKENIGEKVVYEGAFPIEKAESYFWNADALVVSLKNEGYVGKTIPNKAIQYLSYSKPVLCVAGGDTMELLKTTKGGVFARENAQEIAEKIDLLCEMDQKEKENLGSLNKQYFDNNLTTEKLTHSIESELIETRK